MNVSYLDKEGHVLKWVKKPLKYSFLMVESISGVEDEKERCQLGTDGTLVGLWTSWGDLLQAVVP